MGPQRVILLRQHWVACGDIRIRAKGGVEEKRARSPGNAAKAPISRTRQKGVLLGHFAPYFLLAKINCKEGLEQFHLPPPPASRSLGQQKSPRLIRHLGLGWLIG